MKEFYLLKYSAPFILILISCNIGSASLDIRGNGRLFGNLKIDETWEPKIYLSHIPTFNDTYLIANKIIISEADLDSLGNFSMNISFLPENDNLFRIHIVKKGDTPNSLIIGGKNENHMLLLANCNSNIEIINRGIRDAPFKDICVKNSRVNKVFQEIKNLVYKTDSAIIESNDMKAKFIKNQLNKNLRHIADTSANPLVSLFAIYNSNFELNYYENLTFYRSYINRWRNQKSAYFESFRREVPLAAKKSINQFFVLLFAIFFIPLGFYIGKITKNKRCRIEKLSIQERKIFELLKLGATNQKISEECHIGISTVKSHVSNILKKLNVKSRKDIINI